MRIGEMGEVRFSTDLLLIFYWFSIDFLLIFD